MVLFLRFKKTMTRAGPVERDKSGSEGSELACGLRRPVTYGGFHFRGKISRVKQYTFLTWSTGHQMIAFSATTKRKKIQTPSDA
jgi:hypothetical protein